MATSFVSWVGRSLLWGTMIWLSACRNSGEDPPVGRLVFPLPLEISPDGEVLVVANSNFDLRYNSGSLQSYDLQILNGSLDNACGNLDPNQRDACGIVPEEDQRTDLTENISAVADLLIDQVQIGSYANGISLVSFQEGRWRAYLPVRSDANLTFVDIVADGEQRGHFDCQQGSITAEPELGRQCESIFRHGDDEDAALRGLELPRDPVGVAVGPLADIYVGSGNPPMQGNYVLFAHRDGRASLFFDDAEVEESTPKLIHTLSGFPQELSGIAFDPFSKVAWVSSANTRFIGRVGVAFGGAVDKPEQSYLFNSGLLRLEGIDAGSSDQGDVRVIRFDPRPEIRRVYMLSRRPRALLIAQLDDRIATLEVEDLVEVGFGPSRLEVATFDIRAPEDTEPNPRVFAFISCFESHDLYVVDVDQAELVGVVRGLSGPFEMALDVRRNRLYVVDFRSSVLRVIGLERMFACLRGDEEREDECSPELLGIVGRPSAVRELR